MREVRLCRPVQTHSKLPSTYLTINEVFPIWASPTIPTLSTILAHREISREMGERTRAYVFLSLPSPPDTFPLPDPDET